MPVVILDGPEKAGKSTLARLLQTEYGAEVRHFTAEPTAGWLYDLTFARAMIEDHLKPGIVVWDRSWASEVVYGSMFNRQRRLVNDPWLGEWLYGRLIRTRGLRIMLLGPSPEALREKRTADDHPVDPAAERAEFAAYADRWNWDLSLPSQHDSDWQALLAGHIKRGLDVKAALAENYIPPTPEYVGPLSPRTLILGESRNAWGQYPGGFAPFTSYYTTRFGRLLGPRGLQYGWANADTVSDGLLENVPTIVACGAKAWDVVARRCPPAARVIRVPHPAWFYRWGRARNGVDLIESGLLRALGAA